jgi:pilus assembly protein CpaE
MLRGAIISPDQELTERLHSALEGQRIALLRRVHRYPNTVDLVRFLRAAAPQVVFLSVELPADALDVAARIAVNAPGTQVVALNRTCDPPTLLETMRAGIREFVSPPFDARAISQLVERLREALEQRPVTFESTDALYAFLPAKPGVGATTVAVNAAVALSELPDTNVLLADFDLNCGLAGFMLRLSPQFSVIDAAENALDMDENLWPKLVTSVGNLDVLPSGKLNPGFRIEAAQIRHMVEFARRNYKAICVDLSGLMEKFSVELMHEAKKIFMVVTPEIPSLHLARERLTFLRQLDLESRVALVLNRAEKRHESATIEIEKLFGRPIFMSLPNDYSGVHNALTAGKSVSKASPLGKRFHEMAHILCGTPARPAEQKRGLLDLLAPRKKPALAQG